MTLQVCYSLAEFAFCFKMAKGIVLSGKKKRAKTDRKKLYLERILVDLQIVLKQNHSSSGLVLTASAETKGKDDVTAL